MEKQNPSTLNKDKPQFDHEEERNTAFDVAIVVTIVLLLVSAFLLQSKFDTGGLNEVAIVVSVPLQLSIGEDIIDAVTLALEETNYKVGKVKIKLIALDDGDENGAWQVELETRNAEQAGGDEQVVAYIGPLDSGAAKISMPILNRAGVVQISPWNTWPGLTKEGFFPAEPSRFYPTGMRHYVRTVATDDLQGPAAAIWAKELGFDTVYIVDDGEAYGEGVTDLFHERANNLDIRILKHITIDRKSEDFSNEVSEIRELDPDFVYYGGITRNGGAKLLRQLREGGVENPFMGADGISGMSFIEQVGVDNAEGVYVTTIGILPHDIDTEVASIFHEAYEERYDKHPEVFDAFAYEAMKVVLAGIERASVKSRSEIREEVVNTIDFNGIFGTWSFDENGDTTLKIISGNVIRDGLFEYIKTLNLP